MRFSKAATTALLLLCSSPLSFADEAIPKPDTVPESPPTKTASVKPRQSSPNLLSTLYTLANSFGLVKCVPAAIPLITSLPKIPGELISGGAIQQALSQTSRELSDVCDFSITGSVGDTFTSFLPTWYSWYNANSDRIATIISKCPNATSLTNTVVAYETCTQVQAQLSLVSAVSDTQTTSTDVSSGADTSTTSTTDSASAATETGDGFMAKAAAVGAGLLGVAAVL
ncbi:hypothetical protein F5Y18DRAFT_279339 [Xylariaceae sp. FL1019]|nr:hypothetical protein F5Y18DRAFT_279339 [Xylariaceae sp. FL1019]